MILHVIVLHEFTHTFRLSKFWKCRQKFSQLNEDYFAQCGQTMKYIWLLNIICSQQRDKMIKATTSARIKSKVQLRSDTHAVRIFTIWFLFALHFKHKYNFWKRHRFTEWALHAELQMYLRNVPRKYKIQWTSHSHPKFTVIKWLFFMLEELRLFTSSAPSFNVAYFNVPCIVSFWHDIYKLVSCALDRCHIDYVCVSVYVIFQAILFHICIRFWQPHFCCVTSSVALYLNNTFLSLF